MTVRGRIRSTVVIRLRLTQALPPVTETRADLQQTLAIDKSTGEITYFTDTSQAHDGDGADGAGNMIVAMVSATDNMVGYHARYGCGDGTHQRCADGHSPY